VKADVLRVGASRDHAAPRNVGRGSGKPVRFPSPLHGTNNLRFARFFQEQMVKQCLAC
jgi:hypothetical protein